MLLAAKFFVKLGVAELNGPKLWPKAHTREWLHKHRAKFFIDPKQPWKRKFLPQIRAYEPYLPDLARVERSFFLSLVAQIESGT